MKFNLAEVVTLIILASLCPSHSLVRIACSRSDSTRASGTALRRQPDLRVSEYISPIDAKAVKDGSLVEYISGKGAKRLAIVNSRLGLQLEVLNEAKRTIKVPITRVTHHIKGSFAFGDLLRLNEILSDLKPNQVERLWEASYGQKDAAVCSLPYISKQIFGSSDAVRTFATMKLMASFGGVFFGQEGAEDDVTVDLEGTDSASAVEVAKELSFFPLAPNIVQQNLRSRAALKEFKLRFVKVSVWTVLYVMTRIIFILLIASDMVSKDVLHRTNI